MHAWHPTALCRMQVKIGNSAIGGITSSTAAQCFDAMVDPESDMVLIEFSLNDRYRVALSLLSSCHSSAKSAA